MCEFSNSAVRVNNTVSNKFNFKVGVHQWRRSCLLWFMFVMVLEVLSIEFRSILLGEMLYADHLVMIAKSLLQSMGAQKMQQIEGKKTVIYPIFKCNKCLQPPERNYIHKIKSGKV